MSISRYPRKMAENLLCKSNRSVGGSLRPRHHLFISGRSRTARASGMLDHARPPAGKRVIGDITPPEVFEVLRKVEKRGRYETANRLRGTPSSSAASRTSDASTHATTNALTSSWLQSSSLLPSSGGPIESRP